MKSIDAGIGVVLLVALSLPIAAVGQTEVLDNEDIVNLTEAGLPAEVIVAKIETTATAFDTGVEQLVALAQAGVHADVLAAMAKAAPAVPAASEPPAVVPAEDAEPPRSEPEPVSAPSWRVGARFSDALASGGRGPEMIVLPPGHYYMGCVSGMGCSSRERPIRDVSCSRRIVRGGSWNNRPALLRAAGRNGVGVGERGLNIGFRVARTLVP